MYNRTDAAGMQVDLSSTLMPAQKDKVFCIGMTKTGTTSFHAAMQRLGYRLPTGKPKSRLVDAILAGTFENELIQVIDDFDAFEDNPFHWHRIDGRGTPFYEWAFGHYPQARFVLTVRKDTDTWMRSFENHVRRKKKRFIEDLRGRHGDPGALREARASVFERRG